MLPALIRALACLAVIGTATPALSQSAATVEQLLKDGWEVAGYISAWENRSLILFKHKDHKYLVQCSVLIDVMRTPRVATYCYEIR
jgi:hypothetical protein